MSPLPESVDIAFDQFVQELPEAYEAMAYEFRAFARSRKIKSPLRLLQVVMLYCGVDLSLRGQITDTAIRKHPKGCGPWLKAMCRHLYEDENLPYRISESGTRDTGSPPKRGSQPHLFETIDSTRLG